MFGYDTGATTRLRAQMIAERAIAQKRWPFLTTLDLSTITSEEQLTWMIKDRTGASLTDAKVDVSRWMAGYRRRVPGATVEAASAISRWDNEGGSRAASPSLS